MGSGVARQGPPGERQRFSATAAGYRAFYAALARERPDLFFGAFDGGGGSSDDYFLREQLVFGLQVLFPLTMIGANPGDYDAVEIGYGGGGLLRVATDVFDRTFGLDVHGERDRVFDELTKRGAHFKRFELAEVDGDGTIPLSDESVMLVYSVSVMGAVGRAAIVERYIREAYRVLRPSGVALIYVPRLIITTRLPQKVKTYTDDVQRELRQKTAFVEHDNKTVGQQNFRCALWWIRDIAQEVGFEADQVFPGFLTTSGTIAKAGGQQTYLLRKPPQIRTGTVVQ